MFDSVFVGLFPFLFFLLWWVVHMTPSSASATPPVSPEKTDWLTTSLVVLYLFLTWLAVNHEFH